jgi:hypothetical protein
MHASETGLHAWFTQYTFFTHHSTRANCKVACKLTCLNFETPYLCVRLMQCTHHSMYWPIGSQLHAENCFLLYNNITRIQPQTAIFQSNHFTISFENFLCCQNSWRK